LTRWSEPPYRGTVVFSRASCTVGLAGLVASLSSTVFTAAETKPWTPLVDACRCAPAVGRWLEGWGASGEILRAPPGIDGKERFRLATRELGVWITLEVGTGPQSPVLFLTRPEGGERVELSEDCERAAREKTPGIANADDGFTDRSLASALGETKRLVVFLWSPHMPLSVDGLPEIEDAARAARATLVVVTDPASDAHFVEEVARERRIPPEWRRPLASVELLFRDLAVHAPSILAFDSGGASAPLPGYRNRRDYAAFLEGFFSRARDDGGMR
jgi:hypothetical protein